MGLAATLGSIGYKLNIKMEEDDEFPPYYFQIEDIDEEIIIAINRYYLSNLRVDAITLNHNLEVLSNLLISSSKFLRMEVPMRICTKNEN
jgi:hypothetical protein